MHQSARTAERGKLALLFVAVLLGIWCMVWCAGCRVTSVSTPETDAMVDIAVTEQGIDRRDVAAVVTGTIITQRQVDEVMARQRVTYGLINEADCSEYLASMGYTERDWRLSIIKGMVDDVLVDKKAAALGVAVSEAEIDEHVASVEELYPSHESFLQTLEQIGYTLEQYREAIRQSLLWEALCAAEIPQPQPTDEQVREYAQVVAPTLAGRRSSQILFSGYDHDLALDVLDALAQGANFAELASAYSIDSSAAYGGDMGWDSLVTLPEPYQVALDQLAVGQASDIIRSSFGYHIILCTDVYTAPLAADGKIDMAAMPVEIADAIRSSAAQVLADQSFEDYLANLEASALVAVFDADGTQVALADVGLATELSVAGLETQVTPQE